MTKVAGFGLSAAIAMLAAQPASTTLTVRPYGIDPPSLPIGWAREPGRPMHRKRRHGKDRTRERISKASRKRNRR